MATWHVVYKDWNGDQKETDVEVCSTSDGKFYAKNLGLFGCGKNAYSPICAIRILVNDHGQFVSATPNT